MVAPVPPFVSISDLASIDDLTDGNSFVIVTTSGPRVISRTNLYSLLAGEIPSITEWDAAAAEVEAAPTLGAYGFYSLFPSAQEANYQEATLSGASSLTATQVGPGGSPSSIPDSLFRFDGVLPNAGTYWMTLEYDFSAMTTASGLALYFLDDISQLAVTAPGSPRPLLNLNATQISFIVLAQGDSATAAISNPPTSGTLLLCFDIDTRTVTLYTAGDSASMTLATPLAGRGIVGRLNLLPADAALTNSVTFGVSDSSASPVAIPAGYVPLTLRNTVLPTFVEEGQGVRSISSSTYHGEPIIAYDVYLIFPDRIFQIPDLEQTPQLNVANQFVSPQTLGSLTFTASSTTDLIIESKSGTLATNYAASAGNISSLVSVGDNNLPQLTSGAVNVVVGQNNLYNSALTATNFNVIVGCQCLAGLTSGAQNTAFGALAGSPLSQANSCTVMGFQALDSTGFDAEGITAVGAYALSGWTDTATKTLVNDSVAVGYTAAQAPNATSTMPSNLTAIGAGAMGLSDGYDNTAIGAGALSSTVGSTQCTAVGSGAMSSSGAYANCTALGYGAAVTGDNQVQLGNSSTSPYAYAALQLRSDPRDKTDIRDTVLGLDFIMALRPVDYRWDMRDDYIDHAHRPKPPAPMASEPTMPATGAPEEHFASYNASYQAWLLEKEAHDKAITAYHDALLLWRETNDLATIQRDGSRKRTRMHHGLLTTEVKAAMDRLGVDFGGFQDHAHNGGRDVQTLGYDELIAPLIKAVQEIHTYTQSEAFIDRIADAVVAKLEAKSANQGS